MTFNLFVLLGASSDVACRYVLPALTELQRGDRLPQDFRVLGITKKPWDDQARFREQISARVLERNADLSRPVLETLLGRMDHASADLTDMQAFRRAIGPLKKPVALYLGLPPAVSEKVVDAMDAIQLPEGSRIIMEKPFGEDRRSARKLNRALHKNFPESAIFRIDHFLGKQTVQNILGIRFANRVMDPVWNRHHVERVEIKWDETRAPKGRAGYYDSAGALKDMIQNHLLQLMCLTAMEPPSVLTEQALRDRKAELLQSIRAFSREEIAKHTIRARYSAGRVQGDVLPAYADEPGVDPDRRTETFAQVRLFVDNARWMGVPFVLRSGKALAEEREEIAVVFKRAEHSPFAPPEGIQSNRIRMRTKPDRVELCVNVNGPGNPLEAETVKLEAELAPDSMSPYASLIGDVLEGNPIFFIRDDEAEEAWRIIDPIVDAWRSDLVPLQEYPAGSDGPTQQ